MRPQVSALLLAVALGASLSAARGQERRRHFAPSPTWSSCTSTSSTGAPMRCPTFPRAAFHVVEDGRAAGHHLLQQRRRPGRGRTARRQQRQHDRTQRDGRRRHHGVRRSRATRKTKCSPSSSTSTSNLACRRRCRSRTIRFSYARRSRGYPVGRQDRAPRRGGRRARTSRGSDASEARAHRPLRRRRTTPAASPKTTCCSGRRAATSSSTPCPPPSSGTGRQQPAVAAQAGRGIGWRGPVPAHRARSRRGRSPKSPATSAVATASATFRPTARTTGNTAASR